MGNCTSNNQVQPGGVRRVSYPKQAQNESASSQEKSSDVRRPSQNKELPVIQEEEVQHQPVQEESSKQSQKVEIKEKPSDDENHNQRKSIKEEKPQQPMKEETSEQSESTAEKEKSSKENSQKEVSEAHEEKLQQSSMKEEVVKEEARKSIVKEEVIEEKPVVKEEARKSIIKEEVREEKHDVKEEVMEEKHIVQEETRKSIVKEEVTEEKPVIKEETRKSIVKEEVEQSVKEEGKEQISNPSKSSPSEQVLGVLTPKEKELFNLINEYRKANNLKAIPFSPCMTKVAQLHAKDVVENSPDVDGGNMHSWSDKGPWKGMKYTDDHKQAALMWSKPSELTSYEGSGFEISHGYVGNDRKRIETTPKTALDGWKKSEGHNNVIIEKSIWKGKNFQALGVGMYKGYACCWFGIGKDNAKSANEEPVQEVQKTVKEEVQHAIKEEKPEQNQSERILGILSPKEKELYNLINEYRKKNNLAAVPYSPCLTKVAQVHAIDIVENSPDVGGGNMHSWSDKGPWKGMKYTDDHKQAALMWSKPSELTSYKGHGFEISQGYSGGARKTMENTPKLALDGWKSSQGHNDVIIEKSIWKGKNFQALGVGMYKGYACCWFGIGKDNAKPEDVQEPFKTLSEVKMAEKTEATSKPNHMSQEIPQDIMQQMSKQMAEMMGNMGQNGFTVSKVSYSTSSNGGGEMEQMMKKMMAGMEMDGNFVEYKYEFKSN